MSKTYAVKGMTCGGCARSVENAIKAAVPGSAVSVDVGSGKVTVSGAADDKAVARAVEAAGFEYGGAAA